MSSANYTISSLERTFKNIQKEIEFLRKDNKQVVTVEPDVVEWTEKHRIINRQPWEFPSEWHKQLYRMSADDSIKRVMFVKGRQLQITELAANILIYSMLRKPITAVYTSPRYDQVNRFSKDRLRKALKESKLTNYLAPSETGRRMFSVGRNAFVNGSILYCVSAWGAFDALRGIPADLIVVDEVQSIQSDAFPVLEENLSFTKGKMIVIGSPLLAGQPFETMWKLSDMSEWDKAERDWLPKKDAENGYRGFHISQRIAPWITDAEIKKKRRTYDEQRFLNEVEGQFFAGGSVPYLPDDITSLFVNESLLPDLQGLTTESYLGADWGSGGNAFSVVSILVKRPNGKIDLVYYERMEERDLTVQLMKIKQMIVKFNSRLAFVDTGYGAWQLQELQKAFGNRVLGVYYTRRPEKPFEVKMTDFGVTAITDRTHLLDRVERELVKNKALIIRKGYQNVDWLVDAFTCQSIDVQQTQFGRTYRDWSKARGTPDDALHSIAYAYLALLQGEGRIFAANEENNMMSDVQFISHRNDFVNTPYYRELNSRRGVY